jgi:hypothetical protein
MIRIVTLAAALAFALPAAAQSQQATRDNCAQAPSEPATPVAKGEGSGTAPGSSGSTGWSGSGLGGAYNGTAPSGPTAGSPSWHPVTAKGLDPIKGMPGKAAKTC